VLRSIGTEIQPVALNKGLEEREMTTQIGTVPKVQLQPCDMAPPRSRYLYQEWHPYYGVKADGKGHLRNLAAGDPIAGAENRLREFECEDRCFIRDLSRIYEQDIEWPLESLHQEADKMLADMCAGLDALQQRVVAVAKALGAKSEHRPPQRGFPTSRPQEFADVNCARTETPTCPSSPDSPYAKFKTPPHLQDFPCVADFSTELDRFKKMNWLNAINRRLWKYHFRFDQHGKDLKAIERRT
jgi:hypothetical protein